MVIWRCFHCVLLPLQYKYKLRMSVDIIDVIKTRLEAMGMSQAQFAEKASATPAQMSIFLRKKGSLSTDSLNKCLDLVGVDLSLYSKRHKLAKDVASFLRKKQVVSIEKNWTKEDLAEFTHQPSISLLFDVKSQKEYREIATSGIIDIESTYPYFKALVSYYMTLPVDKPTASQAKRALTSMCSKPDNKTEQVGSFVGGLAKGVAIGAVAAAFNPMLGAGIAAASSIAAATKLVGAQVGAVTLFKKSDNPDEPSLFAKALHLFN